MKQTLTVPVPDYRRAASIYERMTLRELFFMLLMSDILRIVLAHCSESDHIPEL